VAKIMVEWTSDLNLPCDLQVRLHSYPSLIRHLAVAVVVKRMAAVVD
jgi:hypothetical protein